MNNDIKFNILTPMLLMSLKKHGNTVISMRRYNKAIRTIKNDPEYTITDYIPEKEKKQKYKQILLNEIERVAGFKVKLTKFGETKKADFYNSEEHPMYLIERIDL